MNMKCICYSSHTSVTEIWNRALNLLSLSWCRESGGFFGTCDLCSPVRILAINTEGSLVMQMLKFKMALTASNQFPRKVWARLPFPHLLCSAAQWLKSSCQEGGKKGEQLFSRQNTAISIFVMWQWSPQQIFSEIRSLITRLSCCSCDWIIYIAQCEKSKFICNFVCLHRENKEKKRDLTLRAY